MRIRVRDLIEELQRFPPDDWVEFGEITKERDWAGRDVKGWRDLEFDRADWLGSEVKIQLV